MSTSSLLPPSQNSSAAIPLRDSNTESTQSYWGKINKRLSGIGKNLYGMATDTWNLGEVKGYLSATNFSVIGAAVGGFYGILKSNPASASFLGGISDRVKTIAKIAFLGAGIGLIVYHSTYKLFWNRSGVQEDLTRVSTELAEIRDAIQPVVKGNPQLEEQPPSVVVNIMSHSIEQFGTQNKALEDENKNLKQMVQTLNAQNTQLTADRQQLANQNTQLTAAHRQLTNQNTQLNADLQQQVTRVEALNSQQRSFPQKQHSNVTASYVPPSHSSTATTSQSPSWFSNLLPSYPIGPHNHSVTAIRTQHQQSNESNSTSSHQNNNNNNNGYYT